MNLRDHMSLATVGQRSDEDLEALFRRQLAPLIKFLEEAEKFDDGYPDAFPADQRVEGQPYYEDGLNIDYRGWTLHANIDYGRIVETTRGREPHGRYFSIGIWAKEHSLYGEAPSLLTVNLYESGKFEFLYFDTEIIHDFDAANDIAQAMKITIQKYMHESMRSEVWAPREPLTPETSKAVARAQALAEIAADAYNEHFGDESALKIAAAFIDVHPG